MVSVEKDIFLQRCRLCERSAQLEQSHIIPNFCYKPLRDIKGRLTHLRLEKNQDIRFQTFGKGMCERLLCRDCEILFSQFESHASNLFKSPPPPLIKNSQRIREYKSLDYRKVKLFFLSILWRFSVTNHEFCTNVSLGPHEQPIGNMLLRSDPGKCEDYTTQIYRLKYRGEHIPEIIIEPTPMMLEQRRHYRFVISGLLIIIAVSKMPPVPLLKLFALNPNSCIRLYDAEIEEFSFLKAIPHRIADACFRLK